MKINLRAQLLLLFLAACTVTAADQAKWVWVSSLVEIDDGADGTAVPFSAANYSYDGRVLIGTLLERDLSGDGVMDERSVSTLTYDSQGQRIQDVGESYDITTGVLDARGIITYTYDSTGNRIGRRIETDRGVDGILDYISTTAFTYDARGNLSGWVNQIDGNGDGAADSIETMTLAYDARDNLIGSLREVADASGGQLRNRETWRYAVNSHGNRTLAEHEIDHFADGFIDYSDRITYAYDRGDRLQSSTTEHTANVEDGVTYQGFSYSTYSYDRHGNQIKIVQEYDGEADGIIEQIRVTTRTYARVRNS